MNIYTIIYDNASFLELQYLSFRKNLPTESFCVVDNAPNVHTKDEIRAFAARHNCPVIPVPNPRFDNAGMSHQVALEAAVNNMRGVAVICDPDVFVLKTPIESMDDYVFAGLMQGTEKVRYLWPGFLVINTEALQGPIDLRGSIINPDNFDDYIIPDTAVGWTWEQYHEQIKTRITTDSGGLLCRYIQKYNPKIKEFSLDFCTETCDTTGVIPEDLQHKYSDLYHFWVIGGGVLHSGRLSNWDHRPTSEVAAKSELVKEIVTHYLNT